MKLVDPVSTDDSSTSYGARPIFRSPYVIYFGDVQLPRIAKTGLGLIEWRPGLCIGQIRSSNCGVDGGLRDMTAAEAIASGAKSLVIGAAPAGGEIPTHWVEDIARAASAGLDIISGMHTRLASFPELVKASRQSGARLIDVRSPPEDLPVGSGLKRTGKRLLTVGTDCGVGKKYTALAIEKEMHRRGWKADFRATGQTGVMIAGSGITIDRVISDFLSGAAEILSPEAEDDHWDVIEGQGSLVHPSFAGVSLGLLHGSQPDALVLCHDATRENIFGLKDEKLYPIPSLEEVIELNLTLARRVNPAVRFIGVSVNSSRLTVDERVAAFVRYSKETGLPVIDPIIDGAKLIVDRIAVEFGDV